MKTEVLTALQVKHLKPSQKRLEIPAGPPAGLYLSVHPTGRKRWYFRYRFEGRTRVMTFKKGYPDWTLAVARAQADAARTDLDNGIDPATKETEKKAAADGFKEVTREFIERYAKRNKSWQETERLLNKEAVSVWGNRPVTEIGRADVLRLLDAIVDRSSPITSNRTLAALRRLFNWSVERGILETSPADGIRAPAAERSRDRVLTESELAEVWQAAGKTGFPFGPFVQFLILTGQRRQEVAGMKWDNIDHDAAVWTLPAESTKAARVHDVPLSSAALDLLAALPRFTKGPYIFTTTSGQRPISGFSKAKIRLDAEILKQRKEAAKRRGQNPENVEPMTAWVVHDLRRSAATMMAKNGVPPHVLAAILNHSPGRSMGISAVYIRHRFVKERREALERWSEFVLSLTLPKSAVKAG